MSDPSYPKFVVEDLEIFSIERVQIDETHCCAQTPPKNSVTYSLLSAGNDLHCPENLNDDTASLYPALRPKRIEECRLPVHRWRLSELRLSDDGASAEQINPKKRCGICAFNDRSRSQNHYSSLRSSRNRELEVTKSHLDSVVALQTGPVRHLSPAMADTGHASTANDPLVHQSSKTSTSAPVFSSLNWSLPSTKGADITTKGEMSTSPTEPQLCRSVSTSRAPPSMMKNSLKRSPAGVVVVKANATSLHEPTQTESVTEGIELADSIFAPTQVTQYSQSQPAITVVDENTGAARSANSDEMEHDKCSDRLQLHYDNCQPPQPLFRPDYPVQGTHDFQAIDNSSANQQSQASGLEVVQDLRRGSCDDMPLDTSFQNHRDSLILTRRHLQDHHVSYGSSSMLRERLLLRMTDQDSDWPVNTDALAEEDSIEENPLSYPRLGAESSPGSISGLGRFLGASSAVEIQRPRHCQARRSSSTPSLNTRVILPPGPSSSLQHRPNSASEAA